MLRDDRGARQSRLEARGSGVSGCRSPKLGNATRGKRIQLRLLEKDRKTMTASGANATTPNVEITVEVATEERADHFRRYGWVKLPGLISRVTAHAIRAEVERCTKPGRNTSMSAWANTFDFYKTPSEHSAFLAQVGPSRQLADVALRLTGLPAVRFFVDSALVKKPVFDGGDDTPWHQDLPSTPLDRRGMLQIWIALEDYSAQEGTLRYMSGSHRLGPLGRTQYVPRSTSITQFYPELADLSVSSSDMAAGDALVHDGLTMHSAGLNLGKQPRWAYSSGWIPADALFTGAPNQYTDDLGLEVNKELDHARFPRFTLADPS
jgi:hypothetical protein